MKRWRIPVMAGVLMLAAGCVSKTEFDAHVANYDALRTEFVNMRDSLEAWSAAVYDWQNDTYVVICDIKVKNVPETAYAPETETYCGQGEGAGIPDPPPDFGPPQD